MIARGIAALPPRAASRDAMLRRMLVPAAIGPAAVFGSLALLVR